MDAAIVGLVGALGGAALGATSAVVAAALSGNKQARAQHQQWRRDVRRTAYVNFLTATRHHYNEVVNLHGSMITEGVRPGQPIPAPLRSALEACMSRVNDASAAASAAQDAVELEGPEHIALESNRLQVLLHLWTSAEFDRWNPEELNNALTLAGEDRSILRPALFSDFPTDHHEQADHVRGKIDHFTSLCRAVLDN